jgi:hypothetical protein
MIQEVLGKITVQGLQMQSIRVQRPQMQPQCAHLTTKHRSDDVSELKPDIDYKFN